MTSDRWPGWLQPYRRWGWWAVLGLGLAAAVLAVWQARRQASADGGTTTTTSVMETDSDAVGGRDVSITGGAGPTAGRDATSIVGGLGPTAGRDVVTHHHYPPGVPVAEPVAGAGVRLLAASARLPADLAPLVGRDTQLAELRGFFTAPAQVGPRVAVVSGLPGVGKSALAKQLAHQLADRVGRPPLYADLGGLSG